MARYAERGLTRAGASRPLARLRHLIARALAGTAALWPEVEQGFVFVHAAARLLANPAGETGVKLRRRFDGLLAAMQRHRYRAGDLGPALDHFRKLARSYRPGLFHAADLPGLPRTNNALATTPSNGCSARNATTSGAPQGARRPHPARCCGVPCGL
ncbi:hypothetical protein [Methylobacterium sp. yr668]|uniref:hypothetical protein n=1 Tax=Methylobacterium sp. yr668 TaxID=1761801 RepID=UPI0008F01634|nr:hypothetical protein [Methylobacterium sp. yr668]SFT28430.1 hypothetical protein SAMN04487845_14522 [Methylobacterium sp. yr668]